MVTEIVVKLAESAAELQGAFDVRARVFVREQQIPAEDELDEADETAIHAVAVHRETIVGTGRAVLGSDASARIGRMAVLKGYRNRGIGGRVLEFLENSARSRGSRLSILHAQKYVQGFYARRGYEAHGEIFLEVDIPHIEMRKHL